MAKRFQGFDATSADEVVVAKTNVQGKQSKVFSPGLHTVKIVSVDEKGPVKGDNTWERLWMRLEGTGGKSISAGVQYPTESLLYAGEANKYPAQQFLSLVQALGFDSGSKNLPAVLTKLFSEPSEALLDLELQVNIGYKSNHVIPKDGRFLLVQKYGKPLTVDGEEMLFDTREAAESWCNENEKQFEKFPEVIGFVAADELRTVTVPAKTATTAKKAF